MGGFEPAWPLDSAGHRGFDFFHRLGNRRAQHAVAVGGDQDIVLDADAAKVLIFAECVVVDVLAVAAFGGPGFDQRRDEVHAGFHRHHHAGQQRLAQAQVAQAEQRAALGVRAIADQVFAQAFHIVHVHADLMAEAVGKAMA